MATSSEQVVESVDVTTTLQQDVTSKDEVDAHEQADAAIRIQSAFRGMKARDEVKVIRQQQQQQQVYHVWSHVFDLNNFCLCNQPTNV